MSKLLQPLKFNCGLEMKNRFMLAPLTNTQSHSDGVLSEEEFNWLEMRAAGGFGLTMTCAAHVQAIGQGFPGQLGVFSDAHLKGLTKLAGAIKSHGSIAICQIHHAGIRSPKELVGEQPVGPSINEKHNTRALSNQEIDVLIQDFVSAAIRSERAGFDGVEIHGAHGYILAQFLSPKDNRRDDFFGGSFDNRTQILHKIIDGIRANCKTNFMLGVRLSPERFGLRLGEIKILAQELMISGKIDFLDMSLWDVFKEPEEEEYKGRLLLSYFTELERGTTKLGVAGNIRTPKDAETVMESGVDWVMLGRAAILHHDFPNKYQIDPSFMPIENPVSRQHLRNEGLSKKFIEYMSGWKGFVKEETDGIGSD